MRFNVINALGAAIVVLLLIPNILYALRNIGEKNLCQNTGMIVLEQFGRYGCMILMWLPLTVGKFGFSSVYGLFLYLVGNGFFLAAYWAVYLLYFSRKNRTRAMTLAVLPACIFSLSSLLLRHWLLTLFAVLFAVGHIYVTVKNAEALGQAVMHTLQKGVD